MTNAKRKPFLTTRELATVAILAAISAVLFMIEIPVVLFYKLDLSHLPVLVDPSHGTGLARLVEPMALAAAAAGADGVMVEVHNDPPHALCDGAQSITPEQFDALMGKLRTLAPCVGRTA